ncbi:hypothetical protein ACTWPB_24840 [Nocardia sp. IBHARD005]|uniref:hypothetical protein n=1 Tax=Nocardia sp. IBHARD005 TaxID=3457765 RepID=UPI004057CF8F
MVGDRFGHEAEHVLFGLFGGEFDEGARTQCAELGRADAAELAIAFVAAAPGRVCDGEFGSLLAFDALSIYRR